MILREGRVGSDEPIRGHLFNPGCGVLGGLTVEHHMRDREIAVESLTSHIVYGDYICACWMWPCKRYLPRSASAGGAWAAAALEYVLPSQAWSRGYKDQDAHRLTNFTDEIPGFVSA